MVVHSWCPIITFSSLGETFFDRKVARSLRHLPLFVVRMNFGFYGSGNDRYDFDVERCELNPKIVAEDLQ